MVFPLINYLLFQIGNIVKMGNHWNSLIDSFYWRNTIQSVSYIRCGHVIHTYSVAAVTLITLTQNFNKT